MMPISWTYQRPWEDYFTVVQWDQRGGGKSAAAAGGKPGEPLHLTVEQMQSDAEDLVRYLLKTYGKRKIILVGHSWGSYLGVRLVKAHPEWFYAYVGIGQVVNLRRNEQQSYALTLKAAQASGDKAAVEALQALAPYPGASGPIDVRKTGAERRWVVKLRGMEYTRDEDDDEAIVAASPDYTDEDAKAFGPGSEAVTIALWPQLSDSGIDAVTKLGVPVFIFAGRHDMTTPPLIAKAWFDRLQAPQKRFFWFEDSAHYVVTEEPGRALNRLVAYVRPLAMPGTRGKHGN
jgi:pimeloyl-ACP methyl ester carboxylesterase